MNIKDIKCWVITEGMIGTENQCLGVCDALGITPDVKRISLNQPWKILTPWLGFEQSFTFSQPLNPAWPDLVISSGRKAVAASRYIKKKSGGRTFTVQIQDPKCSPSNFDLVAVPHHDQLRGDNVIVTDGAPNKITPEKIQVAKEKFATLFAPLPAPRVAVLIGGNSRTHKMTAQIMRNLVAQLKNLNGSLMITASRRTGEENLKILKDGLKDTDAFIWDGTGDNPYQGMLAWADHILVTEDSVSMVSDAATTGKPVHIIPLDGHSKRFDKFHAHMEEIGVTRPFTGNLETWNYEPIYDANKIALTIKEAMQKRYG